MPARGLLAARDKRRHSGRAGDASWGLPAEPSTCHLKSIGFRRMAVTRDADQSSDANLHRDAGTVVWRRSV